MATPNSENIPPIIIKSVSSFCSNNTGVLWQKSLAIRTHQDGHSTEQVQIKCLRFSLIVILVLLHPSYQPFSFSFFFKRVQSLQ